MTKKAKPRSYTFDELTALYPCWCGRPSVEVISQGIDRGVTRTQGYCHVHAEQSHVVITRYRQPPPR